MDSRFKLYLLSAAALAVGVTIALLSKASGPATEEVATKPFHPGQASDRIHELADSEPVPEEVKVSEKAIEERWGHMGNPKVIVHVDPATGELYFEPKRIYRGIDGDGNVRYMRALAKPYINPNLVRVGPDPDLQVPTISVQGFKPGPLTSKLKKLKPIEDPNDMPPGWEDKHPAYVPPPDATGPGAPASGNSGSSDGSDNGDNKQDGANATPPTQGGA